MSCSCKETSYISLVEDILLKEAIAPYNSKPIFILGSPRTGSTMLYQLVAKAFSLPYISNLTNDWFAQHPIVGIALQRGIKVDVSLDNYFGKTQDSLQLSEGSAVMSRWFGGGHPSQNVSTRIIEGKEKHFIATLAAVEVLYDGRPLLIKNAWNCFRISYLAGVLPDARFIWIRRDIAEAAESDLEARYMTKGSANAWNSATPSNWHQLKQLPPHEQVVENQFEFNKAIEDSLTENTSTRSIEIWYEDFVQFPDRELQRIAKFFDMSAMKSILPLSLEGPRQRRVSREESTGIRVYISKNRDRFTGYCYSTEEE